MHFGHCENWSRQRAGRELGRASVSDEVGLLFAHTTHPTVMKAIDSAKFNWRGHINLQPTGSRAAPFSEELLPECPRPVVGIAAQPMFASVPLPAAGAVPLASG